MIKRLMSIEELSRPLLLETAGVLATDGVTSARLWANPLFVRTAEVLFVGVPDLTEENLAPIRHRIACILIECEPTDTHDKARDLI